MSEEGSQVRPKSGIAVCEEASNVMSEEGSQAPPGSWLTVYEDEEGSSTDTEEIPDWSVNAQTYRLWSDGRCAYNAAEQTLVWPPMLLLCTSTGLSEKLLDEEICWARNMLAAEGISSTSLTETKHVCSEGDASYHLMVLPPSGQSFAAAKSVDMECEDETGVVAFYPSLKDILDIKNGRVPEFSRRWVPGLQNHGRSRLEWVDLELNLVGDDGVCVGRGKCQKFLESDCVDGEPLGGSHIGVRILDVVEDLLPRHWKGSLRRWRNTHALYHGVSLCECLRQFWQPESEDQFCEDGAAAAVAQQEVLREQFVRSVTPWISVSKELNDFDYHSSGFATTCQNAMADIEKETFKSDLDVPSLYGGKSFAMSFHSSESLRKEEIEKFLNDSSKRRCWMEHLGSIRGTQMASDVVKRLGTLQELADSGWRSTLISSMIQGAEDVELRLLQAIGERVKRETRLRAAIAGFDCEIKSFILRRRREQHKELLEELASINTRHIPTLEEYVQKKFEFLKNVEKRWTETDSVRQWLAHHTAKVTDEVSLRPIYNML